MPAAKKIQILLGCDPEVFVVDKKTNKIVSAHDLIPGTKEKPFPINHGAIQVDGVAAEFNTNPIGDASGFHSLVVSVMQQLEARLPDHKIKIQPSYSFPKGYLESLPEEVRMLGCNPDYNAWTERMNNSPDGDTTTLRSCAGHLHIGWTKNEDPFNPEHFSDCCRLVRQLDYYIGVPSVAWDTDNRRRELYGRAGAFRPKSYGVEYRTPSNAWLRHPNLYYWLFGAASQAVNGMAHGDLPYLPDKFGDEPIKALNSGDRGYVVGEFKKQIWPHTALSWPEW